MFPLHAPPGEGGGGGGSGGGGGGGGVGGTPVVVPSKFYPTIRHYLSIGAISFPLSI